ncbi:helix-turn-helix transcriptional regulator [Streptomyces roseoverticillatus]|uniref:helix-turn-helix domain-containing protein n=1 Tax=Streptomyces roseoverticillatus TaxID=66429 RepID=UPI00340DBBD2
MGQQAQRTARRRRLGAALKELRESAGVTVAHAAAVICGDNSKVSRIETGRHCITTDELTTLLDLYKVGDTGIREWLRALGSEDRKQTWWRRYGELTPGFKESLTLESEAAEISVYQTQVVPALLQTPEYARVLMAGTLEPRPKETVDLYVDIRMKRQIILRRENPPKYRCVMQEGVVRQQIGGANVMAAQLRRLVSEGQRPGVTIQIIPFSQTTFAGAGGSFYLYSYPEPMDFHVVQMSLLDGQRFLEDDDAVARGRRAFEALTASALSADDSSILMTSIADEFEQE